MQSNSVCESLEKRLFLTTVSPTFPIANPAPGAMSLGAAFDGTNFLVGIQGDTTAHFDVGGQFISPTGAKVGKPISTHRTGSAPVGAFGGGKYLVVWSDDALSSTAEGDDIWGEFVSPSGVGGGAFPIYKAVGNQEAGGAAFDGKNFLVVWDDEGGAKPAVVAQRVSPAGALVGSKIVIGTETKLRSPTVAFGGGKYLVCWVNHPGSNQNGVKGAIVTPAGVAGSPFVISPATSTDHNPIAIGFNGTNFLVAWSFDTGPVVSNPTWTIYDRLVTPTGALPAVQTPIATGQIFFLPGLAFDGTDFLASFTLTSNAAVGQITGQFLNAAGKPDGGTFPIDTAPGTRIGVLAAFGAGRFVGVIDEGFTPASQNGPGHSVDGVIINRVTPPTHLIFLQNPTGAAAGVAIAPAITVEVEDVNNRVVLSDSSLVTLNVGSGPAGAKLGGTISMAARNGIATFSNIVLNTAGSYALKAADGALAPAISAPFVIKPAAASKLVISRAPSSGSTNKALSPALVIDVEDKFGNIVKTDSSKVTVSITSGPTGGKLDGVFALNAVGGVATFGDLLLNKAGTYKLKVVDGLLAPLTLSVSVMV